MCRAFRNTNQSVLDRVDVRDVTFGEIPAQNTLHGKVLTDKPRDFEGEVVDFDFALVLARNVHASSIAAKKARASVRPA